MRSIEFSDKELDTVIAGLIERETRMLHDADAYKNQGNKLAQMDCIDEWRVALRLRERLQEIKYQ